MNHFVQRMLGHYLQDETEEGADLPGASDEVEQEEEVKEEEPEQEEEDEGEVIVTLGDTPVSEPVEEEKSAPQWVKDLRKQHREAQKRVRELEQQVAAAKAPAAPAAVEVGPKPTLEGCDYDSDKFEADLIAWQDRKRKADQIVEDQQRAQKEAEDAWQAKLSSYAAQKTALKLPDYEDAEATISGLMDVTQQGVILSGADNPALVIYALGKNEAKAKELAAIKDPVKFAFAVAKLETQVKMSKKTSDKPAPEKTISGTAPKSGAIDSTLERLRADAEKTGDMSKVLAYKRQQKAKERA